MHDTVVVIGAGVIGLQIAHDLLAAGHQVAIVARHFPDDVSIDYASSWAGAHFRPHSTAKQHRECEWDTKTYLRWLETIREEDVRGLPTDRRCGLALRQSTLLWDEDPDAASSLWFSALVRDFELLKSTGLPPGVASGARFSSIAINVPSYLTALMEGVRSQHAIIIKVDAPLADDLTGTLEHYADLVTVQRPGTRIVSFINATGIGSRELCSVHHLRGQTVLVRGEASTITTRHGTDKVTGEPYIAYVIPRPGSGTTILGGSNERRSDSRPDDSTTQKILVRCGQLSPELLDEAGSFNVLAVEVGFRPARTGGARVAPERFMVYGRPKLVIHAYGHGGAGFQNSIGVASDVVRLLEQARIGLA